MRDLKKSLLLLTLSASLCPATSFADAPPRNLADAAKATVDVEQASKDMAAAARKFLDSLTPEQKAKATFDFKSDERSNWYFVPKVRKGLTLKDMTEEQRTVAKALLASGLSQQASSKALTIMSLDDILKEMEKGKGPVRDPELYYWSVFGDPGKGDWGWRVEGHHISMNFTVAGDKAIAAAAPGFLGANPPEDRQGPRKGLRVLAEEEDLGRALVKSLSPEQMKKALISTTAPKEIITGNSRKASLAKFEGIPYSELNDQQKAALTNLIAVYANRLRPELAQQDLKRIAQAGADKIYFAWAGGTEKGQGHYYRIHSPTVLIEYDDTQNDANHIHTVWRDLENDFGGDLLRQHYDQSHK
jgi:hypothetical protein